jgi:hypothetical protein
MLVWWAWRSIGGRRSWTADAISPWTWPIETRLQHSRGLRAAVLDQGEGTKSSHEFVQRARDTLTSVGKAVNMPRQVTKVTGWLRWGVTKAPMGAGRCCIWPAQLVGCFLVR